MQQVQQDIDAVHTMYAFHMVAHSQSANTNRRKQCDLLAGVQHATIQHATSMAM